MGTGTIYQAQTTPKVYWKIGLSMASSPLVKQDERGLMNIYNYCQRIITHSLIFQNNTNSGRKVCKDRKKKEKKEIVFIVIQKI